MKTYIPYSLILAAAATGMAFGAETAYTTPVGYITATITPNVSGSSAGSATFIAPSLVQPTTFAGVATASPSGGSVINFSGGVPAGLDFTSVLEVSNGAQEGWYASIASSTANSITISDTFPAGLAANVQISVRKFNTIQSVFGNNSPGLAPFSTTLPYDEIQFLNPSSQEVGVIVYASGGWLNLLTESDASGEIIYPGTSVKVIHRANTSLPVIASGEVKITDTQVDVFPNDNWIGQPNPTLQTFDTLNLGAQILTTDSVNLIRTDTGIGQATDAFVSSGGLMYNALTEELAENEPVAEGNGYLINRPSGAASIVTVPGQVIAP